MSKKRIKQVSKEKKRFLFIWTDKREIKKKIDSRRTVMNQTAEIVKKKKSRHEKENPNEKL